MLGVGTVWVSDAVERGTSAGSEVGKSRGSTPSGCGSRLRTEIRAGRDHVPLCTCVRRPGVRKRASPAWDDAEEHLQVQR